MFTHAKLYNKIVPLSEDALDGPWTSAPRIFEDDHADWEIKVTHLEGENIKPTLLFKSFAILMTAQNFY